MVLRAALAEAYVSSVSCPTCGRSAISVSDCAAGHTARAATSKIVCGGLPRSRSSKLGEIDLLSAQLRVIFGEAVHGTPLDRFRSFLGALGERRVAKKQRHLPSREGAHGTPGL